MTRVLTVAEVTLREINFDGIVGPSHNYAGLSFGNVASMGHAGQVSQPRAAALQGIDKMRANLALGLASGHFPAASAAPPCAGLPSSARRSKTPNRRSRPTRCRPRRCGRRTPRPSHPRPIPPTASAI